MYLLNGLHYITLLILNIQVYCWHQVIFHLMLCLTHFFQMPENRIPPLQLQTVNASLKYRKTYNNLYDNITISENTKSCAEKYRCETVLYLLSMLEHAYNIIVDCGVGAPGIGREVIDGMNPIDKS